MPADRPGKLRNVAAAHEAAPPQRPEQVPVAQTVCEISVLCLYLSSLAPSVRSTAVKAFRRSAVIWNGSSRRHCIAGSGAAADLHCCPGSVECANLHLVLEHEASGTGSIQLSPDRTRRRHVAMFALRAPSVGVE